MHGRGHLGGATEWIPSGVFRLAGEEGRVSSPEPERKSYGSFTSCSDPDGSGWVLQEVTTRLPGR
ncbi:hypothetical protein [Streptomyces sp. NPDC001970]